MLKSRTQVMTLSAALALGVLAAIYIFAGSARADLPQEQGFLTLQTQANVRITFTSDLNLRQPSVAAAGDVNGDGIDDLIVGASPPGSMPGVPNNSDGAAFVVFGQETLTAVDPGQLGEGGFRIDAATTSSVFARSVSGAGDVNGDGLADVIIGAEQESNDDRYFSGSAYVVFGKRSATPVSAGTLGAGGFHIMGAAGGSAAGTSVSGAGDVNDDGLEDVIVGSPGGPGSNGWASGSASVVFGKDGNTETVDLAELRDGGFQIDGAEARDWAGISVAGAGDVNGDRIPDLIVGANYADHGNGEPAKGGVAYVVHGKDSTETVDLGNLGSAGFRIRGEAGGDPSNSYTANQTGWAVDSAGDMNSDGLADVIVGAPYADHNGRTNSGSAYVVSGKRSVDDVNLANLGDQGFRIDGAVGVQPGWPSGYSDKAGTSVASVGDVNGGGYDDVIVGAHGAYPRGVGSDGAAYVIYGGPAGTNVDLAALGTRGIQMDGDGSDSNSVGWTVSGAGDFNGDGSPDMAVGSVVGSYSSATSHSAYVVHGFTGGTDNLPIPPGVPPMEAPKKATSTSSGNCPQANKGCAPPPALEFEVDLSNNGKGKPTAVKLGLSAQDRSIEKVTFGLPRYMKFSTKRLGKAKRFGSVRLNTKKGELGSPLTLSQSLRAKRKNKKAIRFQTKGALNDLKVSFFKRKLKTKKVRIHGKLVKRSVLKSRLTFKSLSKREIKELRVELNPRESRFIRNPKGCKNPLKFLAFVTTSDGKRHVLAKKVKLKGKDCVEVES